MRRQGTKSDKSHVPSFHRNRRRPGPAGRDGHRRGRRQRRRQFSQFGPGVESRPAPRDPLGRGRRHPRRHAHIERHDGGRPQRRLLPRAVLLPGDYDALPGHDAGQRAAAGPLQHAGTAHLDHRVDGLRTAGRRRGRRAVPHRRRPRNLAARPLAVHQHGQGDGHHRGDPPVGGPGLRRGDPLHVHLAADLLVPLRPRVQALGRRMVRHLARRHPLFRAVQGAEKLGADPLCRLGLRRRTRRADAAGLLGRGGVRPLYLPAHAPQHHAHHHPLGHLLAGAGLRGQRPGELHRRAAGRLRRLADRRRGGQRDDDDGGARRSRPRELPAAGRLGNHHGADALLLEEVAARHRNRTLARLAARGRRTLRLDPHLPQPRARHAGTEHDVDRPDPGADAESHRPPFRAAARRGAFVGPLRHDPRRGEPHRRVDPDRHRHLLQTALIDDLRGLHGGDGIVARRPFVGTRKRRLPHHGRDGRDLGVVHHGARGIPHRAGRDSPAAVGRLDRRGGAHAALLLAARPQPPQEPRD